MTECPTFSSCKVVQFLSLLEAKGHLSAGNSQLRQIPLFTHPQSSAKAVTRAMHKLTASRPADPQMPSHTQKRNFLNSPRSAWLLLFRNLLNGKELYRRGEILSGSLMTSLWSLTSGYVVFHKKIRQVMLLIDGLEWAVHHSPKYPWDAMGFFCFNR